MECWVGKKTALSLTNILDYSIANDEYDSEAHSLQSVVQGQSNFRDNAAEKNSDPEQLPYPVRSI